MGQQHLKKAAPLRSPVGVPRRGFLPDPGFQVHNMTLCRVRHVMTRTAIALRFIANTPDRPDPARKLVSIHRLRKANCRPCAQPPDWNACRQRQHA